MNEDRYWRAAAAALGGASELRAGLTAAERKPFVRWAVRARLSALLLHACRAWDDADPLLGELAQAARQQGVVAALQEQELRRLVGAFRQTGLAPVLIKGAALAYSIYSNPALRPRSDVDLMIREHDAAEARRLLEDLGYAPALNAPGPLVTSQFHYVRTDAHGLLHSCDVHLRISNSHAYADCVSYDTLRRDAIRLPRLHEDALGPSPAHSLIIACVHRVAHHVGDDDLLWLWDIRLLASSLDEPGWRDVIDLARDKQLSGLLLHGLQGAREAFGPAAFDRVMADLERTAMREPEPPLIASSGRPIDVALSDLAALPTWRARARLVRQHLFPPRSYLRLRYRQCPPWLLPLASVYRIVRGAPKWFRRRTL